MMTVQAHAKINWSIDILGARADGLHSLDSLMETVSIYDTLTFERDEKISLFMDGIAIAADENNLIVRAARALNEFTGGGRGARIVCHKAIPARAGLGGGSADAAATLKALNELWNLALPESALLSIGYRLGCDIPYMLIGGLSRVQGTGEIVRRVPAARTLNLLIVKPDRGLSTGAVYEAWDQSGKTLGLDMDALETAIANGALDRIARLSGNALEAQAIAMLPEIETIKRQLRACGALFARMSGSGSAVFGVFESARAVRAAQDTFTQTTFAATTIS